MSRLISSLVVDEYTIDVYEVTPTHVRISIFPPGGPAAVDYMIPPLDLKHRHGRWQGRFDITGEEAGPFDTTDDAINALVAALTEAVEG